MNRLVFSFSLALFIIIIAGQKGMISSANNVESGIETEEVTEEIVEESVDESIKETVEEPKKEPVTHSKDDEIKLPNRDEITKEVINKKNKNRWNISLTKEEKDLMARIMMLECGGEGDRGQQAVAEVIFNRMVHKDYGDTLVEVLSQKGQFSTWKNRDKAKATPTDRILRNLDKVLAGETNILPFETVYFAMRPQNSNVQEVIGCHYFCNKIKG